MGRYEHNEQVAHWQLRSHECDSVTHGLGRLRGCTQNEGRDPQVARFLLASVNKPKGVDSPGMGGTFGLRSCHAKGPVCLFLLQQLQALTMPHGDTLNSVEVKTNGTILG